MYRDLGGGPGLPGHAHHNSRGASPRAAPNTEHQGFLGTQADFKRRFLMPIQANHESKAVDNLKKLTSPFILRRLKSDKNIIKDTKTT